jgi:hypothetical protein
MIQTSATIPTSSSSTQPTAMSTHRQPQQQQQTQASHPSHPSHPSQINNRTNPSQQQTQPQKPQSKPQQPQTKPQQSKSQPQTKSQTKPQQPQNQKPKPEDLQDQSTLKKLRRTWNFFEVRLIKAADASKQDARKIKANPHSASTEYRQKDVMLKSIELVQARKDLRNLLNEAEAHVKDNARELKALNLMCKSSGYCMGRKRKRKRSLENSGNGGGAVISINNSKMSA